MPSIRKQKIQNRSRQQRRKRPIINMNDMTQTDDERMLEQERQDRYDFEEAGTWVKADVNKYRSEPDEEGFGAFDNGGGALKKRSRQQRFRRQVGQSATGAEKYRICQSPFGSFA